MRRAETVAVAHVKTHGRSNRYLIGFAPGSLVAIQGLLVQFA